MKPPSTASADAVEDAASRAVVLLSGGLDSATCLAMARAAGHECHALSVDYGQRHASELEAARRVAAHLGAISHKVVSLDLRAIGGSALTDEVPVPDAEMDEQAEGDDPAGDAIPATYVPARNTILLGLALGWAEVLGAGHIYAGVNAVDYSGYPDCRPAFVEAFQQLARLATRAGVEGAPVVIETPLIHLSKGEIIRRGLALGVDYGLTVSCYRAAAGASPCGRCDACVIRSRGFAAAGVEDPTLVPDADTAPGASEADEVTPGRI